MAVRIRDLAAIRPVGPPPTPPTLTLGSLFFSGTVNVAFAPQALVPGGGTPPYVLFGAVGLPAGISIDPNTGIISGTPTATGITTATATVTDSLGAMASAPIFFDVAAAVFSYFADSFARADQPFLVGTNWFLTTSTPAEVAQATGVQQAGLWNVAGGTDLVLANVAGPAPCPQLVAIPARINPTPLWGGAQFAEIMMVSGSNAVGTVSIGPAVFMDQNSFSAYVIEVVNNGAGIHYRVDRWVNGVIQAVIVAFRAVAYGDTIRIEVTPGAPHTITIFLNGVQDIQVNDAGIAAAGVPCIVGSCVNGSNMHIRNYKGGSLPQLSTAATFNQ